VILDVFDHLSVRMVGAVHHRQVGGNGPPVDRILSEQRSGLVFHQVHHFRRDRETVQLEGLKLSESGRIGERKPFGSGGHSGSRIMRDMALHRTTDTIGRMLLLTDGIKTVYEVSKVLLEFGRTQCSTRAMGVVTFPTKEFKRFSVAGSEDFFGESNAFDIAGEKRT